MENASDIEARMADIQAVLEKSQYAHRHPREAESSDMMSRKEHFALWDEMWRLLHESEVPQT